MIRLAISVASAALLTACAGGPSVPDVAQVDACLKEAHTMEQPSGFGGTLSCQSYMDLTSVDVGPHKVEGDTVTFQTVVSRYSRSRFSSGDSSIALACNIAQGFGGQDYQLHETVRATTLVTFDKWSDGWRCSSIKTASVERQPSPYRVPFELVNHKGEAITETALIGRKMALIIGGTHAPGVPIAMLAADSYLKELGELASGILIVFASADSPPRGASEIEAYLGNVLSDAGDKTRLLGLTGEKDPLGDFVGAWGALGAILLVDETGQIVERLPMQEFGADWSDRFKSFAERPAS